jgi:hypothetical protein
MSNTSRQSRSWLRLKIGLDMLPSIAFVLASLIVLVCVLVGEFPVIFWLSCAVALAIVTVAKDRSGLVAAAVLVTGTRFVVGAVSTGRSEFWLGAGLAAIVLYGIKRWRSRNQLQKIKTMVGGRQCPKCARDIRMSDLAVATMEGQDDRRFRLLNRCVCGEFTLFDETGASRHVEAHSPEKAV